MVLTNAERQRRHRQRLQEAAKAGVTAEMVREATSVLYRLSCEQVDENPDFAGFIASCHKRRGGNQWEEMVPSDPRPDAYDWVADAQERDLLERVALVASAVLNPPAID